MQTLNAAQKTKKTAAGRIPVDWEAINLVDYIKEISIRNSPVDPDLPVLSVTNTQGFVSSESYFDRKVYSKDLSNYKIIHKEQFAYNPSRINVGSISQLKSFDKGLLSPMYVVFEAQKGLDADYFAYWIKSPRFNNLINASTQGTVRDSVNFSALASFPFALPPIQEQKKMTTILACVDDLINKTQAVIDQTQRLKKSLMQELFTRGLPGRHKKFKKTKVGEIPKEWEITTIGKSCENLDNFRKPLSELEREKIPGNIPYWGPTGAIDYIDQYIFDENSEIVLIGEDGDHFMKWRTWPMAFLVRGKCWVNNHVHVLKAESGCLNEWLWRYFEHRDIFQYLNISGSRTRLKLNQGALSLIPFPLPSEDEQKKITLLLQNLEERLVIEKNYYCELRKTKFALMQVLLTGEVRVR
jgi:type I restriction enzyme S subunit